MTLCRTRPAGAAEEGTATLERNNILLLATHVFTSRGGIQAYMERLTEILPAYCGAAGSEFACLALAEAGGADGGAHAFHFETAPTKVAYVRAAVRLGRLHRPSLVLVGHLRLAKVAWILKRLGYAGAYAVVLHGIEAWKKMAWTDRRPVRGADFFVATTEYTAEEFARLNGIGRRRIRIVPLGLRHLEPGPRRGANKPGTLNILTVGRLSALERYKGVDTLIEALARLRKSGLAVRMTVAGDGDDAPRLKELCGRLQVSPWVRFTGVIPDEELERLLEECDVFAMPSKGEGFGIVFLEAMRYGKPCIGGRHGGTPEVIENGRDGYLVNHGDVEHLAECLRAFAGTPELTAEMGWNAWRKVAGDYLFPHLRNRWTSLLDSALECKKEEQSRGLK